MIRAVLAVAVATTLLAASLPAVETARVDRTSTALDRVPERLDRAAASLSAEAPPRRATRGSVPTARRTVPVTLPSRSLVAAGVDYLALCPAPGDIGAAVVVAAVDGAPVSRTTLGERNDLPADGIVLATPGRHRLLLEPIERGADRRVAVRQVDAADGSAGGSSSNTGPAGPCDPSTGSANGSPRPSTSPAPSAPQTLPTPPTRNAPTPVAAT